MECSKNIYVLKIQIRELHTCRYPCICSITTGVLREFTRVYAAKNTRSRERARKIWPGFCITDSVYTLETQGCRARIQRRKELSVGKYTRPPGLPRKIRRVHGVVQRLFLGSLGSVQELYQGIPA